MLVLEISSWLQTLVVTYPTNVDIGKGVIQRTEATAMPWKRQLHSSPGPLKCEQRKMFSFPAMVSFY